MLKRFIPVMALAGSFVLAAPAMADTVVLDASSIGQSFTLDYNGFVDGGPSGGGTVIDGLAASTTFTLTAINGNDYVFNYQVSNLTTDPVNSRVSSFGFNTDPTITSASSTGTFGYAEVGSGYPNGIGSIDVCFKEASTGACQGGGGGGIADGQSASGTMTLTFGSPTTSATLELDDIALTRIGIPNGLRM